MKGSMKGKKRGTMKGRAQCSALSPVKALKWIILLVIPLNLLILLVSFAFPGRLGWIDRYQVSVQKMVVHQLDKRPKDRLILHEHSGNYRTGTIQYEELMPCLDSIRPGTLFFSVQGRKVSSMFIRSEWKHCGIFLGTLPGIEGYWGKNNPLVQFLRPLYGSENDFLIFDSSYDHGVSVHNITGMADLEGRSTLRKLLLIECKLRKEVWSQALLDNLVHLGKPYDYCFVLNNNDAFYCSEFLDALLPLEKEFFHPSSKIAGRPLLLPADLVAGILDMGLDSGTFSHTACISKQEGAILIQAMQ